MYVFAPRLDFDASLGFLGEGPSCAVGWTAIASLLFFGPGWFPSFGPLVRFEGVGLLLRGLPSLVPPASVRLLKRGKSPELECRRKEAGPPC